ncbi:hypothetical protein ACFVYF_31450 [Streptomyces sp. NPDC058274]|uniref:hypothetical protein n=1 Tax=Streptomyces sp. NPDC058274 TaxID=3346416 RepID=UPI0036E3D702
MEHLEPAREQTMLRLLPWLSPDGKPCHLSTGSAGGYLSRLADATEARQLAAGGEALGHARQVLEDLMSPYAEVRYAAIRLAECLGDALRVAESRGLRIPAPDTEDAEDAEATDADGAEPDVPRTRR